MTRPSAIHKHRLPVVEQHAPMEVLATVANVNPVIQPAKSVKAAPPMTVLFAKLGRTPSMGDASLQATMVSVKVVD
jgi:hypothetical protein